MKTCEVLFVFLMLVSMNALAQLRLGSASSEINFRVGPGLQYKVSHTIDKSNLLVILPREAKNNFVEVFDIETSSFGYVAENLIVITDTLNYQKQQVFEKTGENIQGEVEMELVNQTSQTLYLWVNRNSYFLAPFEKKSLVMDTEEVVYFSSAPGVFPVFGKEMLQKGNAYRWKFSL